MSRRSFLHVLSAVTLSAPMAGPRIAVPANREGLVIGLTAVILADQAAFLGRWSAYLSAELGFRISFVARESYQAILDMLLGHHVDAAWICGYPFVLHKTRLRLLAVPAFQRQPLYRSYLIRSRASRSRIDGWSDLKGKVLAYSDPLSNSGWLVPQSQLATAGIADKDLRRSFFAHGHRNVGEAVAAQLADAGCIDGYVWETMRRQGMPAVERTEVIWQSNFYGFPPLVTRSDSPPEAALQHALLTMEGRAEGRQLLQALNLDGFIAGEAGLFASIERLADRLASATR